MKKKKSYLIIMCFLILLLFAFIFLLNRGDNDNNKKLLPIDEIAEKWHGKQDLPSTGETKEIIIPGFKTLVLIANSSEQAVNLCNPEENECLFKLTLFADDTELWESGFIKPGDGYYNIEMNEPLEVGEYNGKLQYQCYREDGTQLNGAVVTFNLIVKE